MTTSYATDRRAMCRHRPAARRDRDGDLVAVSGALLAVVLGARRVAGRG